MSRLQEIVTALADNKCRYAIVAAVMFADDNPNTFKDYAGIHGAECLKRLLREGSPDSQ